MVGKTALNKEMKHLNGAYFRTINIKTVYHIWKQELSTKNVLHPLLAYEYKK